MKNGKLRIDSYGTKVWRLNDKRHRLDGPAVIFTDGTKAWRVNDKRHRLAGPAIILSNGSKEWWINDIRYTEEEFNNLILTHWIRLFKK